MKKVILAFTLGTALAAPLAAFAARDSVDLMMQQRQITAHQKVEQIRQACIDMHQQLMSGCVDHAQ